MRRVWLARWLGLAGCGVACAPMLAPLVVYTLGAAGPQALTMNAMARKAPAPPLPAWVLVVARWSWLPLFISLALLVASFWRTSRLTRGIAYAGVALLLVNQWKMTAWLFFGGLGLILAAFVVAARGQSGAASDA